MEGTDLRNKKKKEEKCVECYTQIQWPNKDINKHK